MSVRLRVAYVHTSDADIPVLPVSVRVPFVQTSATRLPKVVNERLDEDQTASGMVAYKDEDAVRTSD